MELLKGDHPDVAPLTHGPEPRHADRTGGPAPSRADRVGDVPRRRRRGGRRLRLPAPVPDDPARFPHGVDTPGYLQRSQLVFENGLNALTPFGERPAHPIVTSILHDVTGGALLDLGRVWPAIFAVAIALAGAALGAVWPPSVAGWVRPRRRARGLAVRGAHGDRVRPQPARGRARPSRRSRSRSASARGGRGVVGLVVLLAAAAITHWLFAFPLVLLLGAYAAGVALATWLRRGANRTWRDPRRLDTRHRPGSGARGAPPVRLAGAARQGPDRRAAGTTAKIRRGSPRWRWGDDPARRGGRS